jgi:hypothetical protein
MGQNCRNGPRGLVSDQTPVEYALKPAKGRQRLHRLPGNGSLPGHNRHAMNERSGVLQGILHRYIAIDRRNAIQPAFDALLGVVDMAFAVDGTIAQRAKQIVLGYRPMNRSVEARLLLHDCCTFLKVLGDNIDFLCVISIQGAVRFRVRENWKSFLQITLGLAVSSSTAVRSTARQAAASTAKAGYSS